jgi:hypothetical protein
MDIETVSQINGTNASKQNEMQQKKERLREVLKKKWKY